MSVEINWSGGLQSTFSNRGARPAGTCSAVASVSWPPWHPCCGTSQPRWRRADGAQCCCGGGAGKRGHAAIPCPVSCSAPHCPNASLHSNPSASASCSEIFLHYWGTVFSAYESCTHHAMQTWCCQQKGALDHHGQPWARGRVSRTGN